MADDDDWPNRQVLFRTLPGGSEVEAWFGFVPDFHDATIARLELADHIATLSINAFRVTDKVDDKGHYIYDRHARVTLHLTGVTGVSLVGNAASIIFDLSIRRTGVQTEVWHSVPGPQPGDFEVKWDCSYGLAGALYAREISLSFEPR